MLSHRSLAPDRSVQETRFADGRAHVLGDPVRGIEIAVRCENADFRVGFLGGGVLPLDERGGERRETEAECALGGEVRRNVGQVAPGVEDADARMRRAVSPIHAGFVP